MVQETSAVESGSQEGNALPGAENENTQVSQGKAKGTGGNPPPPPDDSGEYDDQTWGEWFEENNPLYLLSLLFMLLGLWMAGRASQEGASLTTVISFFGVQNLYEILIIGMALYLLKNGIQPRHGKILLGFVLLFAADITFYQFRITATSSIQKVVWVSMLVSAGYLLLAGLKLGVIVRTLGINVRFEQLFYPLAGFGMIYFAPQYFMASVYNLDNLSILTNDQYPQWVFYQICLAAALIQIPVIVGFWRQTPFDAKSENPFFEDENYFYQAILLFPFFILPLQIFFNLYPDEKLKGIPMLANCIPYLICGVFFLQGFIRKFISLEWGLNRYDFVMTMGVLMISWASESSGAPRPLEFSPAIFKINYALIILASLCTAITRGNLYSIGFLLTVSSYYLLTEISVQVNHLLDFAKRLSFTIWAGIMMTFSFITLALGFFYSLRSGKSRLKS